jgi:hypothetical protein
MTPIPQNVTLDQPLDLRRRARRLHRGVRLRRKGETKEAIRDFIEFVNERRANDPLYLDQPLGPHGEILGQRTGANLETGLFTARLTGAFPYTNVKARWDELQLVKEELPPESDPWTQLSRAFDELEFEFLNDVPAGFAVRLRRDGRLESLRTLKGTETRIRPVSRSFFEFARPAAPPRPRWGIQTVKGARTPIRLKPRTVR